MHHSARLDICCHELFQTKCTLIDTPRVRKFSMHSSWCETIHVKEQKMEGGSTEGLEDRGIELALPNFDSNCCSRRRWTSYVYNQQGFAYPARRPSCTLSMHVKWCSPVKRCSLLSPLLYVFASQTVGVNICTSRRWYSHCACKSSFLPGGYPVFASTRAV